MTKTNEKLRAKAELSVSYGRKERAESSSLRRFHGKKGISPLIASVLLIAIVVTVAGILLGWGGAFIKVLQQTSENKTFTTVDCSGANIDIDEVYLVNGTLGRARVVVKNTGVVDDLIITQGVLFNRTFGNFSATNLPIMGFSRGDIEIVIFDNVSAVKCGDFSSVTVSASCPDASDTFSGSPVC